MKRQFDFVVIDSTPSGLIAAIAAARHGLQVAVVTEDKHVGGMQTSGLGWTNCGQEATVGGLTREFHNRIHALYQQRYGTDSVQAKDSRDGMLFEPQVAEKIYTEWLAQSGVECFLNDPIAHVEKSGERITAIVTHAGQRIEGRLFLDASYEGDLLHLAGCSWHAGREGQEVYGESLAGVRFPPEQAGQGDRKLQAYDYRLCLTNDPTNRVPFRQPEGYNPGYYEWHAARMLHTPPPSLHHLQPLNLLPNHKTDSRTGEMIGASWDWPHVDLQERKRIARIHRCYSAGYLWFLLTDPRVPRQFQDELREWGHAADEFADNENWPYHLYVREARRLVGDYVMTQHDTTSQRFKPDAVALGTFYLDVHAVDHAFDAEAPAGMRAEGPFGELGLRPYEISYRSLLPRRDECANLLVTTCLSASHVAYSSIRMEPVFMQLGHAAGAAAALSIQDGAPLHAMPINTLQETLITQGQRIEARHFNDIWPSQTLVAPDVLLPVS